ncbi:MAG: hypothetical protein IPH82_10760 [Chloroflexi bacterium]|nr:hypothetical protein [Chloroflexota bacterium]
MAGIFGTVVAAGLGVVNKPTKGDIWVYVGTMLLLILVGLVGAALHVLFDLSGQNAIVTGVFCAARLSAPLLFANMGTLGLIALLSPVES